MFRYLFLVLLFCSLHFFAQRNNRAIIVGVPFLLITPDARASGMGELGVATSPDAFAQHWNPSKLVFASSKTELGISYTPYLGRITDDIFLGSLTYYNKPNDRNVWGVSLKYFSLGDIQLNDLISGSIINVGNETPNELTLDLSYGLRLARNISMAVTCRYIRSDLKIAAFADTVSANSVGFDISAYYVGDSFSLNNLNASFLSGINISNIGPPLKYDVGGDENYLPTNLRIGSGLVIDLGHNNRLSTFVEFNKLLVPSPVGIFDETQQILRYEQPQLGFLNAILGSFSDAPGGLSEEIMEITYAIGAEYVFQQALSVRLGYNGGSMAKGARRFFSLGTGLKISTAELDLSYSFSSAQVKAPLENIVRFSLILTLNKGTNSAGVSQFVN